MKSIIVSIGITLAVTNLARGSVQYFFTDYQESLKREPLIPVGAPLDFVPRSKQP